MFFFKLGIKVTSFLKSFIQIKLFEIFFILVALFPLSVKKNFNQCFEFLGIEKEYVKKNSIYEEVSAADSIINFSDHPVFCF